MSCYHVGCTVYIVVVYRNITEYMYNKYITNINSNLEQRQSWNLFIVNTE